VCKCNAGPKFCVLLNGRIHKFISEKLAHKFASVTGGSVVKCH
jgi:hypothetical protein